jgi:ATP-dependent Clp protease ATP-binding subunit ClpB
MLAQRSINGSAAAEVSQPSVWISLDAERKCDAAGWFEEELFKRVVAQDDAILALSQLYQIYLAKMALPSKPLGTMLFLGPTGSGKTHSVEAAAEILFGDPHAITKIDCAEFQHSQEISKLIGSPPGYLGHRETAPLLTQENLNRFRTPETNLTLVLFDEIEKASDALWQLLLGILDKATLTLGDNRRVDFSNCIVILTSNLGAREMSEITEGKIGFGLRAGPSEELDAKLEKIGVGAARRKFSPEFMNRLDKVVVFRSLTEQAMQRILELEIERVQRRIQDTGCIRFVLSCTEEAKDFLLVEGYDRCYGARSLKRAIERRLVIPLSNLIATRQIAPGDVVRVDVDERCGELCFSKSHTSPAARFGANRVYRLENSAAA